MNYKILVNKLNPLKSNYVPKHLVVINEQTGKKIDKIYQNSLVKKAYKYFKKMQNSAIKENIYFYIDSSYRSFSYQEKVYNNLVKSKGLKYASKVSAVAGTSEHQTGLAIDIIFKRKDKMIEHQSIKDKEIKWLIKNSYKYGYILRYPKGKEKITGYKFEPWHYRFVGKKLAKYLYQNNLTLEEYYKK